MMRETGNENSQRRLWMVLGGGAAMALCLCMGLAGFALGGQFTEDGASKVVEVTREVTRIVEAPVVREESSDMSEIPATATAPTEPTAVPTIPPTTSPSETAVTPNPDGPDLALFYEAWDLVKERFDGDLPSDEDLLYAIIAGSLDSLDDPYTRFSPPELAARMREDLGGSVSGIGAYVRENEDGFFEIITPIEGQPAELAGLLPGDIVVEVDGESVIGLSFDEVILMVRGPEGTAVSLTIVREGEEEPLNFTIVRARFEVPVVETKMLDDGIGYLQLTEFNRNASSLLTSGLEELLAQNPKGIIFDLRNNPGGFLDQAIAVADLFLDENIVLYERNRQGLDETFRADDGDLGEQIPLVVLVNGGSASASEIVAGALQDNGRAILIGATTFGKGSVQSLNTLSDGSELRVTIARWYTPDNNTIDAQGITPDIIVEPNPDVEPGVDLVLERALAYFRDGR